MKNTPYISIIVPAYNVRRGVTNVIERVVKVLANSHHNYELICVSDGSTDDTLKVAEKEALKYHGKVRVFGYKKNKGKGYAVRFGMSKAVGKVIGFIDADNEINPESLHGLLTILERENAHIVVGSKRHKKSQVTYPWHRKIISYVYFLMVKLLFGLPIGDTQAGVKIFSGSVVKKLLPSLSINGFSFDIEMLVKAKYMGYGKIFDGPVIVDSSKSSDPSLLKSYGVINESLKMFIDTVRLFFKMRFLK